MLLGKKHVWKKKLFTEKFVKDIERAWEYYLTYADTISE